MRTRRVGDGTAAVVESPGGPDHQEPCGGLPGGCLACRGLYHRAVGSVVPSCPACGGRHWEYDHCSRGGSAIDRHFAAPTSFTVGCPLCRGTGICTLVRNSGSITLEGS